MFFFTLKKFVSFWLMPLPFCLTLLVVGVCFLLWTRRARLGKWLLVSGTILLLLFSNKLVSVWLVRPLEAKYAAIPEFGPAGPAPDIAACRYIIVLGGGNGNAPGLSAVNEMSTSALSRITEAVRILRAVPSAKLVVSGPGGNPTEGIPTHAVMLGRAAASLGIEASRVVYIDQAHDTEDESLAVKKIVGTEPFGLVTSAWHMPRTMALFRHAGLAPLPCPADYSARGGEQLSWSDLLWDVASLERSTWAVRERIGYLWIWLRGKG